MTSRFTIPTTHWTVLLTVFGLAFAAAPSGWSQSPAAPKQIAGKSIEQFTKMLGDEKRTVRLRAIKSLGAFGIPAGDALQQALEHEDRAVQYTAAVHLGRIGGSPLESASDALVKLAEQKESLAVRFAAAFALCRADKTEKYLPILTATLSYPDRGTVCSCAELIGMLGANGKAAIPALEEAYAKNKPGVKGGDYHIGGAANNALRKVRGE